MHFLFIFIYSLILFHFLGLSSLHKNDLMDAEQYLQMAARWSQSYKENAIALNNLGTLSFMKLGLSFNEINQNKIQNENKNLGQNLNNNLNNNLNENDDYKNIIHRDLLYFSKKSETHNPILTVTQLNLLNESINYWEEAIEEATTDKDMSVTPQQVRTISTYILHIEEISLFCKS